MEDTNSSGLDAISGLSDEILQQILWFMQTRDAIKTSVLSKRWRHIWRGVQKLTFEHRLTLDKRLADAYDKTLSLYVSPKIKTFVLSCSLELKDNGPRIDRWIKYAVDRGVEDLSLSLCFFVNDHDLSQPGPAPEFYHQLPEFFYKNNSFVQLSLDLTRCNFAPKVCVSWTSLKSLTFISCRLSDEAMTQILSGCPVLETLVLEHCKNVSRLEIKSKLLRRLEIHGIRDHPDGKTEIWAPNICSLSLRKHSNHKYLLIDVSSAVEAEIAFSYPEGLLDFNAKVDEYLVMLLHILQKVQHVENLSLGTWALQILSVAEIKGLAGSLLKCKHLTLQTMIQKWTLPGISRVLQSAPDLKMLTINLESTLYLPAYNLETYFANSFKLDEANYWRSEKRNFLCLMRSLQIVKITETRTGDEACGTKRELLIALLEFILGNARELERMIIQAKRNLGNLELHELRELCRILSRRTRASQYAEVICKS